MNVKTRRQARHVATDELNQNLQWPTGSGRGRHVARSVAARRRRSAQRGQGRPKRAFFTPAPGRNAQRPQFHFPLLLRRPQLPQAQPLSSRSSVVAITAPARAWPLQHHRHSSTVSPAPRSFFPCPPFAFGKRQRRAKAHRSSAADSVVVAALPQSSSLSVS